MIAALKKRMGWADGDEVIVSPVGFPTTIAPLVQNGLKPVFVDIEMQTLNFDVSLIRGKITSRTRAIFVSPVLGNPPDMDELVSITKEYGLCLIGDNCDSLGSKWNSNNLGDYYIAWSTSFYAAHHLCTGEGGMICSNDKEIIDTARSISWWGRDCRCVGKANLLSCGTCGNRFDTWLGGDTIVDHKYVFTNIGYNLKPLDLQGAIGIEQLKKFKDIEKRRRANYCGISTLFIPYSPKVRVVSSLIQADVCWFGVPIICDTEKTKQKLVDHLEKNRVQTRNYFAGNILLHSGYRELGIASDYPRACESLSRIFFLGCSPHYTEEVLSYIGGVLGRWNS
jgi:CDP-6-deoxy-D-xylo-4-hexulose-3-dehydrase